MFSLGPQEIFIIVIIALIIFGPKKLPEVIQTIAKTYGRFKKELDNITNQLNLESMIEQDEDLKKMKDGIKNTHKEINESLSPLTEKPEIKEPVLSEKNKEGNV